MSAAIFDPRQCRLGEGPLWHPLRKQLFWFDILGKKMLSRVGDQALEWSFDEYVSAAGWVDAKTLLIASASQLFRFDLETGAHSHVAPLEADQPLTRSNDGRADPWGGFWIGTMGIKSEPRIGAIYRYYRGTVQKLFGDITVSNSIAFAPDKSCAYFTDTHSRKIMRQRLDKEDGWPTGAPEVFVDLKAEALNPDGSVVDAQGRLWNAQWGAARVACYSPEGALLSTHDIPAKQASCPAFGGDDLGTLYVTSAAVGLNGPTQGQTFQLTPSATGQAEHAVIL